MRFITKSGKFNGYASIFNNKDDNGDIIRPGAFTKTLANVPIINFKVLYEHNAEHMIGYLTEICEDKTGLFVCGQLIRGAKMTKHVKKLMRCGVLDGLSIGYDVVSSKVTNGKPQQLIVIDLKEITITAFPANNRARCEPV